MDLIIASRNAGKIREMKELLDLPGLEMHTFEEFEDYPDLEETGSTMAENAVLKAEALRDRYGMPAVADDSGLLVDALGGRPGVRSSRYAGPECDSERNIDKLLGELRGVPPDERTARYACVIALAIPGEETVLVGGECEGTIMEGRRGSGGFGYDPVFMPLGFDRSAAELTLEDKNAISHRGKAARAVRGVIEGVLARRGRD